MGYVGRPGVSPAVAALLSAGAWRPGGRVLDCGCGTGVDAVEMAIQGLRVTGVDRNRRALSVARRRARRLEVADRCDFVEADVTDPKAALRGPFDGAVDTLLVNNLRGREVPAYARGLARLLRPGALLVVQERLSDRMWRDAEPPPRQLSRWFRLGPTVPTHLPEHPDRPGAAAWARVGVTVAVRNRRRA